ncbi:hypothetical protein [Ferrimicrobium sp.]|uniref:hypothetical protein n=1 Tax=Ferrimicrobium sp. TaxID=2926050 RepID=UPI00262A55F6|nr:hypothetical protein [Ferrimicrobium sp.]
MLFIDSGAWIVTLQREDLHGTSVGIVSVFFGVGVREQVISSSHWLAEAGAVAITGIIPQICVERWVVVARARIEAAADPSQGQRDSLGPPRGKRFALDVFCLSARAGDSHLVSS